MTTAFARQPPAFVPTLTDVVASVAAPAPQPKSQDSWADRIEQGPGQEWVDVLTDRVMSSLMPELERLVAETTQEWLARSLPALQRELAGEVSSRCAEACRTAVAESLAGADSVR